VHDIALADIAEKENMSTDNEGQRSSSSGGNLAGGENRARA